MKSEGYNAELYSSDFITTSYDILASETHLMHIVRAPVDNPPMIRGIVRSPESFFYINIREAISYDHRTATVRSPVDHRSMT